MVHICVHQRSRIHKITVTRPVSVIVNLPGSSKTGRVLSYIVYDGHIGQQLVISIRIVAFLSIVHSCIEMMQSILIFYRIYETEDPYDVVYDNTFLIHLKLLGILRHVIKIIIHRIRREGHIVQTAQSRTRRNGFTPVAGHPGTVIYGPCQAHRLLILPGRGKTVHFRTRVHMH